MVPALSHEIKLAHIHKMICKILWNYPILRGVVFKYNFRAYALRSENPILTLAFANWVILPDSLSKYRMLLSPSHRIKWDYGSDVFHLHLSFIYIVAWINSFFLPPNSIPLHGCTTVCSSIPLLKETWLLPVFSD